MADIPNQTTNTLAQKKRLYLIIGIGGLVLLMVGLIIAASSYKKSTTPTATLQAPRPLPKEVTVTLTKTGFDPKTVTINAGGAVRWTNSTNAEATVNSADHPTHQKYKELNLGTFVKGSTLVHIFETPGTYTYHDHFNPERTGTVIVK